jgi:hypothetical protein
MTTSPLMMLLPGISAGAPYMITQFLLPLVSMKCLPIKFAGHPLKKGGPWEKFCLSSKGVWASLMELYARSVDQRLNNTKHSSTAARKYSV